MPTIIKPAAGDTVPANAIPVVVQVGTQNGFVCLYITARGNPEQVLAGPSSQQAVGTQVNTTWDARPAHGTVDFYACDSADGTCPAKPGGTCPSVTITLT
jgi:hypothetical protein